MGNNKPRKNPPRFYYCDSDACRRKSGLRESKRFVLKDIPTTAPGYGQTKYCPDCACILIFRPNRTSKHAKDYVKELS